MKNTINIIKMENPILIRGLRKYAFLIVLLSWILPSQVGAQVSTAHGTLDKTADDVQLSVALKDNTSERDSEERIHTNSRTENNIFYIDKLYFNKFLKYSVEFSIENNRSNDLYIGMSLGTQEHVFLTFTEDFQEPISKTQDPDTPSLSGNYNKSDVFRIDISAEKMDLFKNNEFLTSRSVLILPGTRIEPFIGVNKADLVGFLVAVNKRSTSSFDVNDSRYNVFGQTLVDTDSTLSLPPVNITAAQRGDRTISLLIDENIHRNFYSSYYIERSTDSIFFTRLNDEPYFFVGPDPEEVKSLDPLADENSEVASLRSAVYLDSVPDYDTYFYYRVIGTNNLGQESAPSPVIKQKAKKPKMDFMFILDTLIYDPATDDIIVHFHDYSNAIESRLIGYQVYKSVFNDGPYDLINTDLIAIGTETYSDIDPYLSGYYVGVTWDDEGYEYRTRPFLTQIPDSMPPPVPTILDAYYVEDEKVKIEWDEVYAEDLNGYYLYYANGKNGTYNSINGSAMAETSIIHDFAVSIEIDSIFFKVTAVDNRGNTSESSEPFGVRRPGKYGADIPVIHSVAPYTAGDKGMVLAFSFSPDEDIKYHTIERRSASNAEWLELKKIFVDKHHHYETGPGAATYIDSTYQRNENHEYRLLVVDQDNFITGSETMEGFPLYTMADGYINDLKLDEESEELALPPLPQFDSPVAAGLPTQYNHSITLSWVYDDAARLEGFVIYRGITGGHLIEYRTVPSVDLEKESAAGGKTKFFFKDNSLIVDKRYLYKVMAQHQDGTNSHMSNGVSVKIELP